MSGIILTCRAFHWVCRLGSHAHLTSCGSQVMLCLYFLGLNLEKRFGLTYIHPHI